MDPEKVEIPIDDEAELDKQLAENIEDFKAGNTPAETQDKPEEKPVETPATPKVEDPSNPPAEPKEEGYEFRVPNKGKFESDESFELRVQLMDQVKRRKLAVTPEAKQALADEIKGTKGQLKALNGPAKINNLNNPVELKTDVEEDPALKADRERLKALGGATKEDIQEILQQDRIATDVKNTLQKFVEGTPELKDEDAREVFFEFVDANYNWQNKTGKELATILSLARESMFKPSETISERVIKGANVQEKINSMQFPGSTGGAGNSISAEKQADVKQLMDTGMSEEKAMELVSD